MVFPIKPYQATRTTHTGSGLVASSSSVLYRQEWQDGQFLSHQCSVCGRAFKSKFKMKIHIRNVHEKVPHPCTKCGKVYRSEGALHNHMQLVHR